MLVSPWTGSAAWNLAPPAAWLWAGPERTPASSAFGFGDHIARSVAGPAFECFAAPGNRVAAEANPRLSLISGLFGLEPAANNACFNKAVICRANIRVDF
jgi:hypothetical protein